MASTAEILAKESLLEPCTYLYREGIFWKAYQQSAYRVIRRRPGLKLKKKYIKAVSCEVISLGFPSEILERIYSKEDVEYMDEKLIRISGEETDMQAYREWFEDVPLSGQKENTTGHQEFVPVSVGGPPGSPDAVLKKIREFPIEQSTPMDCMLFLARVRKELTDYGHL